MGLTRWTRDKEILRLDKDEETQALLQHKWIVKQ